MNSIRGKKILVTGAAGFLGSHLTQSLLKSGAKVTALVRYTSSGQAGWLEHLSDVKKSSLNIIFGDIRDPDICHAAVKDNQYIFHLAAQIAIPYSYMAPRDFIMVNAIGTANILQAAREAKIKKFVQVSTSEVYGNPQYTPMDENHPQTAQSPYAASKAAADKLAQSYFHSFNLPVVIVRPFNCYGPRQSARAIIPTIILQALRSKNIKLGNIRTRRDMNFVSDIISGMSLACFSDKTGGQIINLASGKDFSIEEMVKMVGDILGKRLVIKVEKRRKRPRGSEVQRLLGDSTLAEKLIGYKANHTLKAGLTKTIRFYEKNFECFSKEDYQI